MKNSKKCLAWGVLTLMFSLTLNAQSIQTGWTVVVNSEPVLCLDDNVTGTMVYHAVIKLKDGNVKSVHFNIKQCNLVGDDGKKYHITDTGNDKMSLYWSDLQGWGVIPPDLEIEMPLKGKFIGNYIITKQGSGLYFKGKMHLQYSINEDGEVILTKTQMEMCF